MEQDALLFSRRRFLAGLGASAFFLGGGEAVFGGEDRPPYKYQLGDEIVTVTKYTNGSGPTFICPHDNENTAVRAAVTIVNARGGSVVHLKHSGERNITFRHQGRKYVFDPNRMFTDRGIKASLLLQGNTYSKEAHSMVANFADIFMLHFGVGKLYKGRLVAIHNNSNNAYSIKSYEEGGPFARDAAKVHVNPAIDADDFYFVTTAALFEFLKGQGHNVALQSRDVTDDGSLSVYAARKRLPYVNVEAQSGHLSVQRRMLEALL